MCYLLTTGSYFEQEKLFALNEEDTRHSLSITSLALSPFEAVTSRPVSPRGFPLRCLRERFFVVFGISQLVSLDGK